MSKLIAIDNLHHRDLAINTSLAEHHAKALNLIPVVTFELVNVATQYPIVLAKNEATGQFTLSALMGFEQGENLFWQEQQWQGLYLPLQVQRQPFFIGDGEEQEHLVCVDQTSPAVTTSNTNEDQVDVQPIFTEDGSDSDYFQHIKQCLAQLFQGQKHNAQLLDTLIKLQLIQPMSLELTFINEQKTRLDGLYTIDQARLAQLGQEQIYQLHQDNMLSAIYTMITSVGQIYSLIDRKNKRLTED